MIKVYFKDGTTQDFKISRFEIQKNEDGLNFQLFDKADDSRGFGYDVSLNINEVAAIVGAQPKSAFRNLTFHVYLKGHETTSVDAHSYQIFDGELRFFWHTDARLDTSEAHKRAIQNLYFCASEVLAVEFDDSES